MTLMPMPAGGDIPGVDADVERGRAFLLLAALIAFAISSWHAWNELRYALWGQAAMATVVRVHRATDPGRTRSREDLRVEIDFPEGNGRRREVLRAPSQPAITAGQQVEVQFLPGGSQQVRWRGQRETVWLTVFVFSTGWILWSLRSLAAEARRPPANRRR